MSAAGTIRTRLLAAFGQAEALLALADRLERKGAGIAATRHVAAAARSGLPEAQARLGLCYLGGKGVPANDAEARHWLAQAAEAGNATAQTALASLALRGIGGPWGVSGAGSGERGPFQTRAEASEPDHRLAAGYARQGAEGGSAEAQALLACILEADASLERNAGEMEALYRASATAGWPLGQLGHARMLMEAGTPEALSEALIPLRAAAGAGLPTACFLLGVLLEAGAGGEPDPAAAAVQYRAGAEHGHTGAKTRLGLSLLTGRGVPVNDVEGETWLRRAAMDGDPVAAAVLGDFHANSGQTGLGYQEAARWYRRAAELGHAGAAHALARAIAAGAEGRPDPGEAARWLQAAIAGGGSAAWPELGGLILSRGLPEAQWRPLLGWLARLTRDNHAEAAYYLGVCANGGIGMDADEPLARLHYLRAASLGFVEAMAAGAEMLLNGRGGEADPDLAAALFRHAAARQHPGAVYALGVLAGPDASEARSWFQRAAVLGHPRARAMLEQAET